MPVTGEWPCFFERQKIKPPNLNDVIELDRRWMIAIALNIKGTGRWHKWNSDRISDDNPIQKIAYLPQLNISPTKDAVVHKTMQIALEVAEDCNQSSVIVTYDLAIAKKAWKIQNEMIPKFDKIFINLGSFHFEMSYFKAVGKYIDSSGIPQLLINCGLLAEGSMNGFISGSNFNRSKNLHMVASTSLKALHFRAFLNDLFYEDIDREIHINELQNLLEQNDKAPNNTHSDELNRILKKYDEFCQQTLQGDYGSTAKFIMGYIRLIDYYFLLERCIRTSDFDLYMY